MTMDDGRTTLAEAAPRRVTMTDVARVAGCSQATVSLVLNNAPGVKISAERREKVIEAARSLGYQPTALAHLDVVPASRLAPPAVVGFVVDQLATSPEAVVAIEGARQACWDEGRVVLAAQTMNDPEMEAKTIAALLAQGAGALVYMTIFTRRVAVPQALERANVPVVLLNCYSEGDRFPSVVPGELEGGLAAMRHLLARGHRRIGMITGEPWMEAARDRLKGYRQALAAAGVHYDPALVLQGNWSPSAGYECTRRLLALPDRPTAIFCQNDRMAIGAYEAIKEAGLHIPDDVSVVGYDDEEISRHLFPQLTTVVLPHRAMAHWAVERLSRPAAGGTGKVRIDCTLIARDSVRDV
jgi:LacI family transcriptional regulator